MSDHTNKVVDLSAESDRVRTGRLPRFNYKVRIVEEPTFKISKSSNNPMLVFEVEVFEPHEVQIKDETYATSGIKLLIYAPFVVDEETGTEVNRTLGKIHRACGLPLRFTRHEDTGLPQTDEGTPIRYTGLKLWIQGDSEERIQKDDNDQPLIDPVTGEQLKGWSYNVRTIYAGACE